MKTEKQSEITKSPFSTQYRNGWGNAQDEWSLFFNKQKHDFVDIYDLLEELARQRRVPYTN